jgi:autophagy-related protein 16
MRSWDSFLLAQLEERASSEVAPFSMIAVLAKSQERAASIEKDLHAVRKERDRTAEESRRQSTEMETLRLAAQGLTLHSAKEKELEERLSAMDKQLRHAVKDAARLSEVEMTLRETEAKLTSTMSAKAEADLVITQLTSNLAEQSNTNSILKRENEALQTENAMQRQQFSREKEDNERLIPQILTMKRTEAELRNEINELEQQLIAAKGGAAASSPKTAPARELVFTDPSDAPSSTCVAPTYVAFCTDDAHSGDIHSVCMTENGRQIWTGGAEKAVKGWDSNNGSAAARFSTAASSVCVDSKSNYLVAGCVDYSCRVWHLPSNRLLSQLTGHSEVVTAAYFNPDASRVITASRDCTVKAWDVQRGALQHTSLCVSSCYDLAVATDRVCTAHFDNSIRLWDIRSGKAAGDVRDLHDKAVTSVRVSSDGQLCATLSRDNSVKIVDLRTLQVQHTFTDPRFSIASNLSRMTLSPDGAYCAAGTSTGLVAVFNVRDHSQPVKFLKGPHTGAVTAVAWSPDGRGLTSVGSDRRIVLWR